MPRSIAVMLATVLAFATQSTAAADHAWLIVVDDLHIDFAQTGRLRTLLRAVATELIHDGDVCQLRATGPSAARLLPTDSLTSDRDLLAPAIKAMTGNGLRAVDALGTVSGRPASNEVLYRANLALDAAADALSAFAAADGRRKAIIYVSNGYDVDRFPAVADRVSAFARRSREDGIAIFAIDARGFDSLALLDSRVDPDAWLRYMTATGRSLTMMAEQTGGFVIEKSNAPTADLKRISLQIR